MPTRFVVECDDEQASAVEHLAHRYGIPEEAVLRQLIAKGLEAVEEEERA